MFSLQNISEKCFSADQIKSVCVLKIKSNGADKAYVPFPDGILQASSVCRGICIR